MSFGRMRRRYDRFAPRCEVVFAHQQRPKIRGLLAALPTPLPHPTVDLGAGTGLAAQEADQPLVQLDASRAMLSRAEGCRVVGDLNRLPFRDDAFACALSVTALIDFEDPTPALGEMARVVRPGGLLALSVLKGEDTTSLEASFLRCGLELTRTLDLGQDLGYVCRIIDAAPRFGSH